MAARSLKVDVLIIGTGPLGCTFARKILDNTKNTVMMVDIGAQLSAKPGENVKNSAFFQNDINSFTGIVQAHQHLLSVPSNIAPVPTLDPSAYHYDASKYPGVQGGHNPKQHPYYNLPSAAVTYAIGGMATHWTACTPRENPEGERPERSSLLGDQEWDALYGEAEKLLNTNSNVFDSSIRQQAISKFLKPKFKEVAPLPLGVEKMHSTPFIVKWTGADTVLGEANIRLLNADSRFCIKSEHICQKLITVQTKSGARKVEYALVRDYQSNCSFHIAAKYFVVAAGAILTPQLLFASDIRPPALGKYLCEQTMTFCQIVLSTEIIDYIRSQHPDDVERHQQGHRGDPIPIPMDDPNPQLWLPVTKDHLYHCQIHRDSFAYGGLVPNVDTRLIVDLRWFARSTPEVNNRVEFETDIKDLFGMPQPTFHFALSKRDSKEAGEMMAEMCSVATTLGGYLPGAEPGFLEPGTALHITGTTRMGNPQAPTTDTDVGASPYTDDCVVDTHSCVIGFDNLYIGSCGVIPTGTACNPTLTAVALAVRASNHLIEQLIKK